MGAINQAARLIAEHSPGDSKMDLRTARSTFEARGQIAAADKITDYLTNEGRYAPSGPIDGSGGSSGGSSSGGSTSGNSNPNNTNPPTTDPDPTPDPTPTNGGGSLPVDGTTAAAGLAVIAVLAVVVAR